MSIRVAVVDDQALVRRGFAMVLDHQDDIGAATVKSHVSSILTKLGLRDRAQAVVFAYESGLTEPGQHDIGH